MLTVQNISNTMYAIGGAMIVGASALTTGEVFFDEELTLPQRFIVGGICGVITIGASVMLASAIHDM